MIAIVTKHAIAAGVATGGPTILLIGPGSECVLDEDRHSKHEFSPVKPHNISTAPQLASPPHREDIVSRQMTPYLRGLHNL